MSAVTAHYPYILYSIPYLIAAVVLIRAKVEQIRAARAAKEAEAQNDWEDDPIVEDLRARPFIKRIISYGT